MLVTSQVKESKIRYHLTENSKLPLVLVKRTAIERCATTLYKRNSVVKGKKVSLSVHIYVHLILNVQNGQTNQFQQETHGIINIYFNIGSFLIATLLEISI